MDGNAVGGFDCPVIVCWGECLSKNYPSVNVATDVCGDIPPTIPPYIDCSLCGLGWPQAYGMIDFRLYRGSNCADNNGSSTGILGDYSYWLNGAYLPGTWRFQCRNPGNDAEPNANEWVAGGDFSWGGRWRISAVATVVNKTTVSVNATIWFLNPTTRQWMTWVTFGQTMTEDNPGNDTDPRRVRIFRSGRIAISPNSAAGGAGDVTHVSMTMGTYPQIVGCGTELCSMWDGAHYYTCFRTEVTDPGKPAYLAQLGKNPDPCGTRNDYGVWVRWCNCDQITLKANGQHEAASNGDPDFIAEYGWIGVDPANPPYDVVQQVQVGGAVIVKKIGDGQMFAASRLLDTDPWTIVPLTQATVKQSNSPTIFEAVFGNPAWRIARLYTLAFPNPGIVPDACVDAIDPVPPGPSGGSYWCVGTSCVRSPVRPAGATAGPFAQLSQCQAACGVVNNDPYWCVNNICVQAAVEPEGATGGPYASAAECNLECSGNIDPYWCVEASCVQSALPPDGATSGPHPTLLECQEACGVPPTEDRYWCVGGQCVQSAEAPDGFTAGPFDYPEDCAAECDPPQIRYWCVAGTCVESENEPLGSTGGPYATSQECAAACQAPNSSDPHWCVFGDCVQSAIEPAGSSGGPYPDLATCQSSCVIASPVVYACTPSGCLQMDLEVAVAVGYPYSWTTQACAAKCVIKYFCGEFGCFSSLMANPPQATAGPYATAQECLDTGCGAEFANGYYYCVLANDGSTSCGQYLIPPSNFVGGPYSSMAQCGAICSQFAIEGNEGMQQLPPNLAQPSPVQKLAGQILQEQSPSSRDLVRRLKEPCKKRGGRLPLMGYG